MGQGKSESAIEDFDQAIRLNPAYPEAYYNNGLSYQRLKQNTKAISFYEEGLKRKYHPQVQQFLLDLILEEAIKSYQKKEYPISQELFLKFKQLAPLQHPKRSQVEKALQQIGALLKAKKE